MGCGTGHSAPLHEIEWAGVLRQGCTRLIWAWAGGAIAGQGMGLSSESQLYAAATRASISAISALPLSPFVMITTP
ncbi:MAG: hypothetical protein RLZZ609_2332 [Cyanobacteriota bacterium]